MRSYARMSTHLLSPLMEFNEENHSSFLGSYSAFKPCEYVWYDVQVTMPEDCMPSSVPWVAPFPSLHPQAPTLDISSWRCADCPTRATASRAPSI